MSALRRLSLLSLALGLVACADAPPASQGPESAGRVAIGVAALSLSGVGDVVWDIEVRNGATPTPEVVWQRRVTSSGYGDSAGSASYIGPCDADTPTNTVNVWVVGVYADDVSDAGEFASGSTADAGAVTGTEIPFVNPTESAPLTRDVTCLENRDAAVQLDVTLQRPANQGFFDIAVNFDDIFCSAKLDCCADANDDDVCAPDGTEDIELLFDAGGDRARTIVLGFACTAGVGGGVTTELYMDDLELDCSAPNDAADFAADLTIRPLGGLGNQCTAGADGIGACDDVVTEENTVDADDYLFQVGVYRGSEGLTSGGAGANKLYWNVALGVTDLIGDCRLRTRATADDAESDANAAGGVIAAGAVYPSVVWDVDLDTCADEPLSFGAGGAVRVTYSDAGDAADPYGYTWSPTSSGPVCYPACYTGQPCIAPNVCDPEFFSAAMFPESDGTIIGDLTDGGGLAAAFDGDTSQNLSSSARLNANVTYSYIGKDWGAGAQRVVTRYVVYSASDYGLANGAGYPEADVRVTLQGSNDGTSWTDLHQTATVTDYGGLTFDEAVMATPDDAYRYHRVQNELRNYFGVKNCCNVAEAIFYGYDVP